MGLCSLRSVGAIFTSTVLIAGLLGTSAVADSVRPQTYAAGDATSQTAFVKVEAGGNSSVVQVTTFGGNFMPREVVQLNVQNSDGTGGMAAAYSAWTVVADDAGFIEDDHELVNDPTMPDSLLLSALGQSSGYSASAAFMAAINVDLDQLQNGTNSSAPEWANGNINTTNSCYSEGNAVPFRYFISGTTAGTQHSFTISMEWTKGGVHAYDYIVEYDQTEAGPILTAGGPCGIPTTPPGDCASPTGTYPLPNYLLVSNYTGAIPSDFFTTVNPGFVLDGPGNLRFYNATIDSIGKMYFAGTASDRTLEIPVYFTTTNTGSVGMYWGGHLASGTPTAWGIGNGSASVGGAPYHMRALDFDGGGGANQDRSIQNGSVCLPPDATLSCTPNTTVCNDSTYTCSASLGADDYTWAVTGGLILSGQGTNSISYQVTAAAGGSVQISLLACDSASACPGDFCCAVDTVTLSVVTCNSCPVATCHGDTSIYLCSPQEVCIPGFGCTDADGNLVSCTAVGGTLVGNTICFSPSTSGVYTLKLIAVDGAGCADTCQTNVTVTLNQAPVAACPGDTTIHACSLSQICLPGFGGSDPDGNLAPVTATGGTLAGNTVCLTPVAGLNEITLIATDSCGRADTCKTNVTVVLNAPPVASCHGDTTMFVCDLSQICLSGFSASDPNGNLATVAATGGTLAGNTICFTPVLGLNTLRLIATDSCGAADTCETKVTIAMNNSPVATCPGNQSLLLCDLSPICVDGFGCSDPDGNGTGSTVSIGTLSGSEVCFTPVVGANQIQLICTDACGKADTCTTVITVALNTPPTVTLGADFDSSLCAPQQICVSYTVNDLAGAVITEQLSSTPPGATIDTAANTVCFTPGASGPYVITVTVTDSCGASAQDAQTIDIQLNQPPILTLGADTVLTLCQSQAVCVNYAVSDPNGSAGLLEQIVSGPAGTTIDTLTNKVCFTPAASGNFMIVARVTDSCGLSNQDTVVVTVTLNQAPVLSFGPNKIINLCASQQICETYTVSDPDGMAGLVETMVSLPPGAILDTAANKICFTPLTSGTYSFVMKVTDPCGAFDQDNIILTVTVNQPPSITFSPDIVSVSVCSAADTTICVGYTISDPDGSKLVETLVSGAATLDTAANTICLAPNASGTHSIIVRVTDSCGTFDQDTTVITINRALCCPSVAIEKIHNTIQGTYACVNITMQGGAFDMGGFDLLISYDASALSLSQALPGSLITDCNWEYFTYRTGANGNCSGSGCPTGLVRLVALAETNNGPFHPICYGPNSADTVQLAQICFLVSNDRTLECQYAPIRFFWADCGDNTLTNVGGDSVYISDEVYDYDNATPINNGTAPLPSGLGAPNYCTISQPGKPALLRCIDFYNGGIDIICADSIDGRGDVNLNNQEYEIADAVMFTRYFLVGTSAFPTSIAGSTAATDVNADGVPLSVADLVYLIRVIIGDASPIPKTVASPISYTVTDGVLAVHQTAGAALVIVEGNVAPELLATNMRIATAFDGAHTRILIYPDFETASHTESFVGEVVHIGSARLVSIELATADGRMAAAKNGNLPTDITLSQNYPNPFNPSTEIEYTLPSGAHVSLGIYDLLGHEIRTLVAGEQAAGRQTVTWDGRDSRGRSVSSGVYFYRLTADGASLTRKMVLLK